VVGVDISEEMIARSNERAKRKGVEGRIEFQVADAQNLPFQDALFDVVISESATAFLEDKQSAINQYVRVTKPGGYIGLNETTWIKGMPPTEIVEYLFRTAGGVKPETPSGWKELASTQVSFRNLVSTGWSNISQDVSTLFLRTRSQL